jgi:DUF971 family protein
MAGLDRNSPTPTEIKLHQKSRLLDIAFSDGRSFQLTYEFLRVYSPSAEVRGHGPGQETLQTGKRNVDIVLWQEYLARLEAAGASRDADTTSFVQVKAGKGACGH